LQSAVDRARTRLAYEPKATLFELAASLGVGLAKNHAFHDGNKRTALLATRAFLFLNRYALEPAQENEVVTMIGVADGSVDEKSFARWLEMNSKPVRK
jgi:death-on-curing protein